MVVVQASAGCKIRQLKKLCQASMQSVLSKDMLIYREFDHIFPHERCIPLREHFIETSKKNVYVDIL